MEKELENGKNIIMIIVNYDLKENINLEREMEKEKNMMKMEI